jgi:polygalacturonase
MSPKINPSMKTKMFLLVLVSLCIVKVTFAIDVNITKYGAVGDGTTLNSSAIQKAIDDCSKAGGGRVIVPAGKWLCGTILLKNGVVLSLNEKATLLGSTMIEDYFIVDGFTDGTGQLMGYCFVGAVDASNVGIEGGGMIDGQGKLVHAANGRAKRPFLVRFVRCEKVKVKDVHLQSSTAWTMHVFRCKNVNIQGVSIYSRGLANNDGIDIDCCDGVVIKDCDITSDDDAICFKTTSPYPCRNIVVEDIKIRTNCAAVKFGTESTGDFQNIKVSDLQVTYAGLGIVKVFSVDGAHISNIDISDIDADTVNLPILIRLGARLKTFRPGDVKKPVGTISNIKIHDINVKRGAVAGMLFTGIPNHSIDGISVEDVTINMNGGGTSEDSKVKLAENEAAYPEIRMFGKTIPSYGVYIRHANNIKMKDVSFTTSTPDARTAIIAEDVKKIELSDWKLPVVDSSGNLLSFSSVTDAVVRSFQPSQKPAVFLNVEGKDSRNIRLQNIDFIKDKSAVRLGDGVSEGVVIR